MSATATIAAPGVVSSPAASPSQPVPVRERYEKALRSNPRLWAAVRHARAEGPAGPVVEVAAAVAAPLLIGFVLWTLEQAGRHGYRRLCFVARDGQVLWRIAQVLAPKLSVEVELTYLYGSRQAWNQAAIDFESPADQQWLLAPAYGLTLRQVLRRAGVTTADVKRELLARGLDETSWDKPLQERQRAALVALLQQTMMRELVLAEAALSRNRIARYLAQLGLLNGASWALVDTGWQGRSQHSLNRVLAKLHRPPVPAFNIGCLGGAVQVVRHAYLPSLNGWLKRLAHLPVLIEMFCQADHGTVLGYGETADGRIHPRLQPVTADAPRSGAVHMVQDVICAVAESYEPTRGEDLRSVAADVLDSFWNQPTCAEVSTWGAFGFESDHGRCCGPVARPYRCRQAAAAFRRGRIGHEDYPFWPAGSWALTPAAARRLLRVAAAPRRLAAKLKHSFTGGGL